MPFSQTFNLFIFHTINFYHSWEEFRETTSLLCHGCAPFLQTVLISSSALLFRCHPDNTQPTQSIQFGGCFITNFKFITLHPSLFRYLHGNTHRKESSLSNEGLLHTTLNLRELVFVLFHLEGITSPIYSKLSIFCNHLFIKS